MTCAVLSVVCSGSTDLCRSPLDSDASLTRVASVLRVSSKRQLDFPSIHQLARRRLENMFPHEPEAFFHADNPDVALTLAVEYSIYSVSLHGRVYFNTS